MLKFIVLSVLFAFVLSQDPCTSLPALPAELTELYDRIKGAGAADADYKALCAAQVADLTASLTDTTKIVAAITDLSQKATAAAAAITDLNLKLATAVTNFDTAYKTLVQNFITIVGQSAAFQNLVGQYADAKAAIALECSDLKAAIANATAAITEMTKMTIEAQIAEQTLLVQSSSDLTLAVASAALGLDAATKAKLLVLAQNIGVARTKQAIYAKIDVAVRAFITNNQGAVEKCLTAVQTQQAALSLGIKATLDEVKQKVVDNVDTFKERVKNVVKAAIDDVQDLQIVATSVDSVAQSVVATIKVISDTVDATIKEKIRKAIQAIAVGITLAEAKITETTSVKRGTNQLIVSYRAELTAGSTSISTLLGVSATVDDALTKYQTLMADATVKSTITAAIADATAKTLADLQLAQQSAATAVAAALVKLQAAKAATDATLVDVVAKVEAAKAAISSTVTDIKAKITAALALRKSLLDRAKAEVAQKVEEIKSAIEQAKEQLATILVQLKDVNTKLATATGDAQATLQAQKDSLVAAVTQKTIEIAAQVKAATDAAANIQAALQKIAAEQAEIQAKITQIATKLLTSAKDIQDKVTQNAADIKAKIIEALEAVVPQLDNVTATAITAISIGARIELKIAFDDTKISLDTIKKHVTIILGAQLSSDNVEVTATGTSTKRTAQTTTITSNVGSTDGSSTSSSPSGLSPVAIGGIIAGAIIVLIVVVILIVVFQRKSEDSDYNAMRA